MVKFIQSKYDFPVQLNSTYKLCDFKPAYGEIFYDWIREYDFWGHCDIDLFWGNIREFISEDVLDRYDVIYSHGHCCLYRNTPEINQWYRTLPNKGWQCWKDVFTTHRNCCFDEWAGHCGGGMSLILKDNQKHVYDEPDMADLDRHKAFFNAIRKAYGKNIYFRIDKNGCFVYRENRVIDEVIYVHFQKRKMKVCDDVGDVFYFVQPRNVLKELKDEKNFAECICYGVRILTQRVVHKVRKLVQLIRQRY